MGNTASDEGDESTCVGYRVLGVQPNSPASAVGLVSFFDFIVAANGIPLQQLDSTLMEMIKASENKPLPITVYNYKSDSLRSITITPSRKPYYEGMLGVTIRFDSYFQADDHLVRVLSVVKNSPAHIAGLMPETDYLLGTAERVFKDTDALHDELMRHLEQTMEIYVYSTETDQVRVVVVLPTLEWGGEGCLGAEMAHGYLHRLPAQCRTTTGVSVGPGISMPTASYPYIPSGHELADAAAAAGTSPSSAAEPEGDKPSHDGTTRGGAAISQQGMAAMAGAAPPPRLSGGGGSHVQAGMPSTASLMAANSSASSFSASHGGVIDVDLSSTATQAVAPHLRPRD
ncbi:GRASP55/65 PDZ-like domain-containing protein [Tribonema minus]|uniref:GRASP55/65 PDZ-like domain-containing protein n=1 Tax=Tribonema minus TaxID=303371 RepID=A0A835YI02_9STRA|nr:GRASP55/65 PDZ-like domain-containing protein [Tribonema minus]